MVIRRAVTGSALPFRSSMTTSPPCTDAMRATASDMTISPPVATPCSRDAVFTTSPIAVKSENPDRQRHAAHGRLLETGLTPARVLSRRAFARTSHQPAAESRERAATGLTPRGRREPGEDPYSPTHRGVPEVIEEARPFLRVGLRIFGAGWRALVRRSSFSHRLPPIWQESGRKNREPLS